MTDVGHDQELRAALDAARAVFGAYDRTPAPALWQAGQSLLQRILQRPALTGQALVGEARRSGVLSLPDAHALVALSALADATAAPPSTEQERIAVREAWMALQHAVPADLLEANTPRDPWAPPPANAKRANPSAPSAPSALSAKETESLRPSAPSALPAKETAPLRPSALSAPPGWSLLALLATLLAAIGGAWWFTTGRDARLYDTAVASYQRGARDVARQAFAELAQRRPEDARPLVYLGRLSREDGDLARARRLLTNAVRVAPSSAVANRELAAVMLADQQPEIARRFYVRALQLDPTDRVAQGFLGCALLRLGRLDEARRWIDRAGPGDWQRCVPSALPLAPAMPLPAPPA